MKGARKCFPLTRTVTDDSLLPVLPHQTDEFKSSGLNITTTACSQRLNPHQPLMLFNVAEMLYNGAEIESALVLSSPEDLQN